MRNEKEAQLRQLMNERPDLPLVFWYDERLSARNPNGMRLGGCEIGHVAEVGNLGLFWKELTDPKLGNPLLNIVAWMEAGAPPNVIVPITEKAIKETERLSAETDWMECIVVLMVPFEDAE